MKILRTLLAALLFVTAAHAGSLTLLGAGKPAAGGAGSWHTVYDATGILTGTDDGGGDGGFLLRTVITSPLLTAGSSTQARATLLPGSASATVTGALTSCFIGQGVTTGNLWNFTGTQVQLLFSGGATVNFAAGVAVLSDPVTLGELFDNTKPYILSCGVSASNTVSFATTAQTGASLNFDSGLFAAAGTTTVTGLSTAANTAFLLSKLEVFF